MVCLRQASWKRRCVKFIVRDLGYSKIPNFYIEFFLPLPSLNVSRHIILFSAAPNFETIHKPTHRWNKAKKRLRSSFNKSQDVGGSRQDRWVCWSAYCQTCESSDIEKIEIYLSELEQNLIHMTRFLVVHKQMDFAGVKWARLDNSARFKRSRCFAAKYFSLHNDLITRPTHKGLSFLRDP